VAGWNLLRAAASMKLRAWVSSEVAQTLKGAESGPDGRLRAFVLRLWDCFQPVFRRAHDRSNDPEGFCAARAKTTDYSHAAFCR
jgi:hypothetical protein